jgi:hypothetical protein
MASPIPTIPSIRILLEMVEGYWPNLDSWLSRPLERGHVKALSPDAKKARKRAQIRLCKANKRRARAVANRDALTPTQGGVLRDILHIEPCIAH